MKFKVTIPGRAMALGYLLCATASPAAPVYTVPATANIYSAGLSSPIAPGGGGAGTLPVFVAVSPGQSAFQFSASGSITENIFVGVYHGPDGGSIAGSTVFAYGGLSGFMTDLTVPLAGVFLSDAAPSDPAPPTLDFRAQGSGLNFLTLSPQLGQVFFIGDGQTDGSMTQTFYAPAGATRLFLGCPDSVGGQGLPGAYDDNAGTLSVTVTAVPEPTTGALSVIGLAFAAALHRRRDLHLKTFSAKSL